MTTYTYYYYEWCNRYELPRDPEVGGEPAGRVIVVTPFYEIHIVETRLDELFAFSEFVTHT